MFQGLSGWIKEEIIRLAPAKRKVKVVAPAKRKYSVWTGGSILASLAAFPEMGITWLGSFERKHSGKRIL